jgi:serine/threonine-protein kinase
MNPEEGPDIGIRAGDVIAEKYRVDRLLGVGGMGVVVAARHLGLDELVAIKLLLPESLGDAESVQRFESEARAAVKIKSEHVARIIDVGELDNGAPFIVMEYLDGEDLAEWIRRKGPLGVYDAIDLLLQACEAIAEAHALGIVHRDIKPANLFCVQGADGGVSIKVLDFGISKLMRTAARASGLGMTKTRAVMGSPYYMSPEQMESPRTVDARTDIWSLGVVLHQMLAGEVPFTGETLPQVCVNVATRPAPPLRKSRPDVPQGLEAIVLCCLEKDPSQRFSTIAALATALAKFGPKKAQSSLDRIARASRQPEALHRDSVAPGHASATDRPVTGPLPSWGATAKSWDGRRKSVIGWIAGALLVSGGLIFAVVRSQTRPSTSKVLITPPRTAERKEIATVLPGSDSRQSPTQAVAPSTGTAAPPRSPANGSTPQRTGTAVEYLVPGAPPPAKPPPASAPMREPSRATSPAAAPDTTTEINPYEPAPELRSPEPLGPTCVLNLNSTPAARVVLDGRSLGLTPKLGITVPAGEHRLFFRSEDGQKQTSVTCGKGETKTVEVRLDNAPPADGLLEKNPYR